MKNYIVQLLGLSLITLFVMPMMYSCGSSGSTTTTTAPPLSVTLTLVPASGTPDAVNLNSMFYEVIPASAGIVDPNSIKINVSPSFLFTEVNGFSSGTFANYIDIVPAGFLPEGTKFSVTTNFLTVRNGTIYAATAYNAFTTVASAGVISAEPGDSSMVTINNIIQPSGLNYITVGTIPVLAISIITTTAASNPTAAGADGSMLLYGGEAFSPSSPTDMNTAFALPLTAAYKGDEFMSSGSLELNIAGTAIPLQSFNLSGIANTGGTVSSGVLYGVVHCTDSACSNITDTTAAGIVSQYIDNNGNMAVLGTFTGVPNTFTTLPWIGSGDTVTTNLVTGGGAISTAVLEVTTTSSPLTTTVTLPFVILTTTDANNMLGISGGGQGAETITTTAPQVTINYPLFIPGLSLTPFSTTVDQTYQAFFMFGLTPYPQAGLQFTP
jgi:hypothetical protein